MAVDFDVVITDEACTLAAIANSNSGWYLSPLRWELSSSSYGNIKEEDSSGKQYGQSITYNTRTTAFYSGPFSSVIPKENTLLHSIVIPPDLNISNTQIASINFIYRDMYGNEFLYAVAQPTSSIEYVYGTKQQFLFSFAISNTTMSDTYVINYTYPQDIQDHNVDINAHDYFLKIDGSRNATGVLSYSTSNNFTKDNEIIDKKYADTLTTTLRAYVDSLVSQRVTELKQEIQQKKDNILDYYCPIGSMLWWPQDPTTFENSDLYYTKENGCWAIRNGTPLSKSKYPELFEIIRYTYNQPEDPKNGDVFRVPNDEGLFIRGYDATYDKEYTNLRYDKKGKLISKDKVSMKFGKKQESAIPNIMGRFNAYQLTDGDNWGDGAFRGGGAGSKGTVGSTGDKSQTGFNFNAIRGSLLIQQLNEKLLAQGKPIIEIYKDGIAEVRPPNRNYLPIIRVK